VNYALVCRMQSWSLVCAIIEIVLECITIILYSVVFYRYYSKQRLRKSMSVRDRARSDLYLAQLRTQTAPNTPGFGPLSPSYSQHMKSPRFAPSAYASPESAAEEGYSGPGTRFVEAKTTAAPPKPFTLQAPPIKVHSSTPKTPQTGFAPLPPPAATAVKPKERVIDHVQAAPGEQTYAAVPIPGAYASPLTSPGLPPQHHTRFASVGQAMTSEQRIDSPPGSPRGFK